MAFLLPPALPHAGARAIANTYTSLLLHGSARAMEELAAGLCWLHWHSSRGRKKGKVLGVYVRPVLPQQAQLIRLVQVLQVQILNEVLHNAHNIALSCEGKGLHSIPRAARVEEIIT